MGLKERIQTDMKDAMRQGDKQKVAVLRMLLSEMQYAKTAGENQVELDDRAIIKVIKSYHKRLEKSLNDYPDGEKKSQIQLEMKVVEHYLPAMASEETVNATVDNILANETERNFGKLMKKVMSELGDAADGKIISRILKEKLKN